MRARSEKEGERDRGYRETMRGKRKRERYAYTRVKIYIDREKATETEV